MINEQYIIDIRNYIKNKTGILYFKDIKKVQDNIMVTCPFHKGGQENRPSASIRITNSDRALEGLFHCFNCGESMMLPQVVEHLLGSLYDKDEVESLFGFETLQVQAVFQESKRTIELIIPEEPKYDTEQLKQYDFYHEYLAKRGINESTAKKYSLGFDSVNKQITFPIRTKERYCIGIGRRSIEKKFYSYPSNMTKPLYRSI